MNPASAVPRPDLAVLVAEDEVLVRIAVCDFLRGCGFEVYECASATEARGVFLAGLRIDILFSDINMPGSRDGIDLALWVELNYPETVVVLTSGLQDALRTAGMACKNVQHFLAKPYDHSALEELLRSFSSAQGN